MDNRYTAPAVAGIALILTAFVFLQGHGGGKGEVAAPPGAPADLSRAAARVLPSLVRVENEGLLSHPDIGGGGKQIEVAETSEGAGFFVDRDGLILTNYHVVEGAQAIKVVTSDKKGYPAELVGADVLTDVALIKIKPGSETAPAVLGDSGRLKVGQWVLAMGNPLGLEFFTSVGIVSGFGPPGPNYSGLYDFIQTSMNIDPGNSGGPLLDADGRVVGMNNAYLGPGTGIGFAIPINRVREVVGQLLTTGRISRGFMGIMTQPMTPGLAERLGLAGTKGVLVTGVMEGGPAAEAGLVERDVILKFNGSPVDSDRALQEKIITGPAGAGADLLVFRNGAELHIRPVLGEFGERAFVTQKAVRQCGISFKRMTPDVAKKLGIEDTSGLIVLRVMPGCPAFEGGLRFGDVVKEVEGRKVLTEADFYAAYSRVPKGRQALVRVMRDRRPVYITIRQGEQQ